MAAHIKYLITILNCLLGKSLEDRPNYAVGRLSVSYWWVVGKLLVGCG